MKAIANSSVLIGLSGIRRLDLLHHRFPEGVIIPDAVWKEVNSMEAVKVENNMLKLPERIAKRLRGRRIEFAEVKEGILLKASTTNPISEARGFLKGRRFTTHRYLKMKKVEKELE